MARPEKPEQTTAFEKWYATGRDFSKTSQNLAINLRTLYGWADRHGWTERADRRDMQAARKLEADAIARRAKMIEDQRKIGQALRNAGAQYLQTNGVKSAKSMKDAVAAIAKGFELERQAECLPDWVGKIIDASDDELRDGYAELLRHSAAIGSVPSGGESEGD